MALEPEALIARLAQRRQELGHKQVVAGFDGFIDSLQKVIIQYPENRPAEYFKTVGEFGQYISAKQTGGLSLETEEITKKIGGNVPIMANAMAGLGVKAHCIGAFGHPVIDPVFLTMHPNTSLYSFANPGITSALEFSDGKIMLAQMTGLNNSGWEQVKHAAAPEQIMKIFSECDMLCLLNWSEIRKATEIWQGLLQEVFPNLAREKRMKIFFDLSDCSKYSNEKILEAIKLIRQFSNFGDVTLSMNRNEAALVCQAMFSSACDDLEIIGGRISEFMNIGTIIIHTAARSLAWRDSQIFRSDAFKLKDPQISTGAGDNFNAGFCIGQLLELETGESLTLANILAAFYMQNGKSADWNELQSTIK
jgi:hypothetical protein